MSPQPTPTLHIILGSVTQAQRAFLKFRLEAFKKDLSAPSQSKRLILDVFSENHSFPLAGWIMQWDTFAWQIGEEERYARAGERERELRLRLAGLVFWSGSHLTTTTSLWDLYCYTLGILPILMLVPSALSYLREGLSVWMRCWFGFESRKPFTDRVPSGWHNLGDEKASPYPLAHVSNDKVWMVDQGLIVIGYLWRA